MLQARCLVRCPAQHVRRPACWNPPPEARRILQRASCSALTSGVASARLPVCLRTYVAAVSACSRPRPQLLDSRFMALWAGGQGCLDALVLRQTPLVPNGGCVPLDLSPLVLHGDIAYMARPLRSLRSAQNVGDRHRVRTVPTSPTRRLFPLPPTKFSLELDSSSSSLFLLPLLPDAPQASVFGSLDGPATGMLATKKFAS